MKFTQTKSNFGFTLVEVIVVIGIMATLSAIIFSSFDGAKAQSRDKQRLADISNIQLTLEIYFNQNGKYPITLGELEEGGLISEIPTPPSKANTNEYKYNYFPISRVSGSNRCIFYHLWTTLEMSKSNTEMKKGFDSINLPTDVSKALYECEGGSNDTRVTASSSSFIYDVTP